jgi:hypothetical protein
LSGSEDRKKEKPVKLEEAAEKIGASEKVLGRLVIFLDACDEFFNC